MKIEKLTPQIGAVIREINLNEKVTDDLIEKIKETFYENLVIFIEEQNISPKQFIRFAKHFGELGVYPFVKGMNDFPEIVEVRKRKMKKLILEDFGIQIPVIYRSPRLVQCSTQWKFLR